MQKILMVKVRLLSGDIWAGQASGDQKMFRDTNDIKRLTIEPNRKHRSSEESSARKHYGWMRLWVSGVLKQ